MSRLLTTLSSWMLQVHHEFNFFRICVSLSVNNNFSHWSPMYNNIILNFWDYDIYCFAENYNAGYNNYNTVQSIHIYTFIIMTWDVITIIIGLSHWPASHAWSHPIYWPWVSMLPAKNVYIWYIENWMHMDQTWNWMHESRYAM